MYSDHRESRKKSALQPEHNRIIFRNLRQMPLVTMYSRRAAELNKRKKELFSKRATALPDEPRTLALQTFKPPARWQAIIARGDSMPIKNLA